MKFPFNHNTRGFNPILTDHGHEAKFVYDINIKEKHIKNMYYKIQGFKKEKEKKRSECSFSVLRCQVPTEVVKSEIIGCCNFTFLNIHFPRVILVSIFFSSPMLISGPL